MSAELIAILAVGVALASVILSGQRRLEARITALEHGQAELRERLAKLADIPERFARVEHGQAKLEGLLEGLREAIAGRRAGDAA